MFFRGKGWEGCKESVKKVKSPKIVGNVEASRKVFPHWSQKTITHHGLSLFPTVSRLGYRNSWLLGLGELLHDKIVGSLEFKIQFRKNRTPK